MRFEDGLIYLITGSNGSGKSTFLRCIAGFEKPDSGSVHIEGKLLYQPQQAMLFPLTGYDNVLVGRPKAAQEQIEPLFARLEITPLMNRGVRGLSGGERQKIALIRSLVTGGDAMLLDEPFSALDTKSSVVCLELLQDYAKKYHVPLLFVSHAIDAGVRIADHRLHFDDGKLEMVF